MPQSGLCTVLEEEEKDIAAYEELKKNSQHS
jgi:hypothetical protein